MLIDFKNLALHSYGALEYNLQHYFPLLSLLWWKFSLHFIWYALYHVMTTPIVLYINAKPMRFSGIKTITQFKLEQEVPCQPKEFCS